MAAEMTKARDEDWKASLTGESKWVRWTLIALALGYLTLFLFVPLAAVFAEALKNGLESYLAPFQDPDTLAAIRLTFIAAALSVPLNLVFGVAAAWAIAKFEFIGKQLLITIIDIPLAVSPVISGLIYVLLFGAQGWVGPWLIEHDIRISHSRSYHPQTMGKDERFHRTLKADLLSGPPLASLAQAGRAGTMSTASPCTAPPRAAPYSPRPLLHPRATELLCRTRCCALTPL